MRHLHPRRLSLMLSLAGAAWLAGCVVAPAGPYRSLPPPPAGELVYAAPPAPYGETVGMAPVAGHVWIGGYWNWVGNRHVWVAGHWTAPRPGHVWVPHAWVRHGQGWHLQPGHWRRL